MLALAPRTWLRVALACSLLPLALGVAIFALWLPTHWEFLTGGGLLTILFGTFLCPVGVAAAGMHHWKARKAGEEGHGRKTAFALALLLLNFSTALTIAAAAARLRAEFSVIVINRSGRPLDAFDVLAGRPLATAGQIPAGAARRLRFRLPGGEHSLSWRRSQEGATTSGDIAGYVDGGEGGDWRVIALPDGRVRVDDLRQPFR